MGEPKSRPGVSVIIPVYNCEATIGKAVLSALGQSEQDVEVVVVDDGSTDRTRQIVTGLAAVDDRTVYVALPKNVGVSAARNIALTKASGEWVAVLDADDWFLPDRLRNMRLAAERLDADLVCDNLRLFDHALGHVVGVTRFGARGTATPLTVQLLFDLDHAFRRHHLGFTKPMIKTAFLKEKGISYNSRYRVGEDFLLLAEAVLNGARAFVLPSADYVYVHRISPSARTVAPNSRADTGFADIKRSCRYLLATYGNRMIKDERRGLAKKRKSISDWLAYMDALSAIRERNFRRLFSIIRQKPIILLIKIYTVRNRVQDLLMIKWSRLVNFPGYTE